MRDSQRTALHARLMQPSADDERALAVLRTYLPPGAEPSLLLGFMACLSALARGDHHEAESLLYQWGRTLARGEMSALVVAKVCLALTCENSVVAAGHAALVVEGFHAESIERAVDGMGRTAVQGSAFFRISERDWAWALPGSWDAIALTERADEFARHLFRAEAESGYIVLPISPTSREAIQAMLDAVESAQMVGVTLYFVANDAWRQALLDSAVLEARIVRSVVREPHPANWWPRLRRK